MCRSKYTYIIIKLFRDPTGNKLHTQIRVIQGRLNKGNIYKGVDTAKILTTTPKYEGKELLFEPVEESSIKRKKSYLERSKSKTV